ncbi:hypothetical protein L1987_24235 [Smallanthus sonchifolius]|uniref:Uncharacterized protein n=1 Tax=Smallanthus sonchifolius TaxID=185202 RepID=A0ACB9ILB8_9ASTR|nr:hypothetical protein L1987_24235 [Smallanthus sonchifolius]
MTTDQQDFFIVLHEILAKRVEVSDIHCVKDAKVPLMRFKFEGISVDLPYAQLQVTTVPENVDILNPLFLNGIDETSWKSLFGVRANNSILKLVPDVKIFQQLLRCVKLWAKRRGVYGNLFGFFGGVHLAVLTAFVCQRNPNLPSSPHEYFHSNITTSTSMKIRTEFCRGYRHTQVNRIMNTIKRSVAINAKDAVISQLEP